MQTLYFPVDDLPTRGAAGRMTDKRFLEQEIGRWLASDERARQIAGEAYYEGVQDILRRQRTVIDENGKLKAVEHLPNNRLIDNQFAKMVDQKTNYLLGKPFSFDTESDAYGEALSSVFTRKVKRMIRIVGENAYTGGKAWVYPYYDQQGKLAFTHFPAYEVLPFWADNEHTDLDCAVRLYPVTVYDATGEAQVVNKVEVFHGGGIDRFVWEDGILSPDPDAPPTSHAVVVVDGKEKPYNWERMPLVCFKANHRETPLLHRVKCLQDALNLMLSNFVNSMEEDVRNTVLVIHNYDGEDLGEFRRNLATYGAIKVRSYDGRDGSVETLEIAVNAENFKTVLDLLKNAIIENARGFDAKDERLNGSPNQLNIQSMYSDIDLDANEMETEFQAAFEELLWFVNQYLANTGAGVFDTEDVSVIFDRDILINESEAIDNCVKSEGILSKETVVKAHPWVDDPQKELERLKQEEQDAVASDPYRAAFVSNHTAVTGAGTEGGEPDGDE